MTPTARAILLVLLGCGAAPLVWCETGADAAPRRVAPRADPPDAFASDAIGAQARQAMLDQAEAALRAGELERAAAAFERAGSVRHAADAELGLIRTWMQGGEYRRALAFAAHTAGAHPDAPAGIGLYAWLLHIGGQQAIALQLLARAQTRMPQDATLAATAALLKHPAAAPAPILLASPGRFAPLGEEPPAPTGALRVNGSATLVDGGRRALTSRAVVGDAARLWLRDGLGRVAAARIARRLDEIGLVGLELDPALDGGSIALPDRDPFPGSPAFAVEFARDEAALPAWPQLHVGFLGAPSGEGVYRLGIDAADDASGGPVYDAAGRLVGVTVNDRGHAVLLAPSRLRRLIDAAGAAAPVSGGSGRLAVDEIYERSLRAVAQVLVAR